MDNDTRAKAKGLIDRTRVMTIAVAGDGMVWSAPVYFVYKEVQFFFFSNEKSRHVLYASAGRQVAASIFHDSDQMNEIFGFQMSGKIEPVPMGISYLKVVKRYVGKFDFLKKAFGPQIVEDRDFFLKKFKSRLYTFIPEMVYVSDNSKSSGKRSEIDLKTL